MAIADNSRIQTPQPLFGGRCSAGTPSRPCRASCCPASTSGEAPATAAAGTLTLEALLEGRFGGTVVSQPYGSTVHPVGAGESIIVGLSTGGTGHGDPLDRDPALVERDVTKNLVSAEVARSVYGVIFDDRTDRVDAAATGSERARQVADRLSRGCPFDEFCEQWLQRKPPEEILEFFGSWPDGAVVNPLIRM
jgi:N-methylhydantoinase B/oxoprolinase/acetone carboxylase alpha subunit